MRWLILATLALTLIHCTPPGPSLPSYPPELAEGAAIYNMRCRTCHQSDGKGTMRNTRYAADFTDPQGPLNRPNELLALTVKNGIEGRYSRMPAFAPILEDKEIDAVLRFIRATYAPENLKNLGVSPQ
jgi:mono/diheme cytochrome c family protein